MNNELQTNEYNNYTNSVVRIEQSAFNDYYCKALGGKYCDIQLPKFPSRNHKYKNFKYILGEIMQNS